MRIIKANNFTKLHSIFSSKFKGNYEWVFRGQSNRNWQLLPKAGRHEFVDYNDLEMFRGWCRRASAYSKLPENEWDRLAISQHHGFATRLLDWSFNPLVASYFAVAGSRNEDGIIYCFKHKRGTEINPDSDSLGEINKVSFFRPSSSVNRIVGQWGVFTYHPSPNIDLSKEIDSKMLGKIVIPADSKEEILFDLNFYGFNESTLFPDLDGLSRFLNWWSMDENWRKDYFINRKKKY